jgi:hypothetical protein
VSVDAPADKAPETVAVAEDIKPVIDADASVDAPADKAFVIAILVAFIVLPRKEIVEVVVSPTSIVELVLPIRIVLAPPYPNHNSPVPNAPESIWTPWVLTVAGVPFPINTVPLVAEVAIFTFPDVILLYRLLNPVGADDVIVFVITEVSVDAPALKAPAIDINDAVIADPTKPRVVLVPPIFIIFVPVPAPRLIVPVCPFPEAILTKVDVDVVSCRPILIVPVVNWSATLIPTEGETCIVAPVIVFVATEVSVVAPALIVPKAFVPVQVLLLPKRDTDAVST